MAITDQVICLRSIDYSETSQILHLLSREHGLLRLLAKGSKRAKSKSAGAIDLFSEGRCVFAGSAGPALGTLMEFAETVTHTALRDDLRRLHSGLYMLELCGALLAESDPHPEVFDLLHNALARLQQSDASPPAVLAYFQWRLIRRVGLLGELKACAGCGKPTPLAAVAPQFPPESPQMTPLPTRPTPQRTGFAFSSAAGGLLCRSCQASAKDRFVLSGAALSALSTLEALQTGRRVKMPDEQADALNALLAYHIQYQLGKKLKSLRYVLGR